MVTAIVSHPHTLAPPLHLPYSMMTLLTDTDSNRPQGQKGAVMNLTIATKAKSGWQVVSRVRLSRTGSGPVAQRLQGTHYSALARQAARQFAGCPAMERVDYQIGSESILILRTA